MKLTVLKIFHEFGMYKSGKKSYSDAYRQSLRDLAAYAIGVSETVVFTDTSEEIEARLQGEIDKNSCPHCGGSGHKEDVK